MLAQAAPKHDKPQLSTPSTMSITTLTTRPVLSLPLRSSQCLLHHQCRHFTSSPSHAKRPVWGVRNRKLAIKISKHAGVAAPKPEPEWRKVNDADEDEVRRDKPRQNQAPAAQKAKAMEKLKTEKGFGEVRQDLGLASSMTLLSLWQSIRGSIVVLEDHWLTRIQTLGFQPQARIGPTRSKLSSVETLGTQQSTGFTGGQPRPSIGSCTSPCAFRLHITHTGETLADPRGNRIMWRRYDSFGPQIPILHHQNRRNADKATRFSRHEIVELAKERHLQLYTAFADARITDIEDMCLEGLAESMRQRLSRRTRDELWYWTRSKDVKATFVSFKQTPSEILYKGLRVEPQQCVVRIVSDQQVRRGRRGFLPSESHLPRADRQSIATWDPPEDATVRQDVIEYLVLQRRLLANEPTEWKVWGFVEETTLGNYQETAMKDQDAARRMKALGLEKSQAPDAPATS